MKNSSISVRIIVGLVVIVVLVLGISGTVNIVSARSSLNKDLQERVVQLSERLAVQMASYVWDLNNAGAENVLMFEFKDESLAGIEIVTTDGSKFISLIRNEKWEASAGELSETFKKENDIVNTSDVIRDDNSIAKVSVYFTNDFVNKEIAREIFKNIIQIIILILIIVLSLLYMVKVIITKPLKELLFRFESVSKGEADLTCRIETHSHDEIGQLADCLISLYVICMPSLKK